MSTSLDRQIEVYEGMAESLEAKHLARWVVIHGEQFIGAFDRIEDAGRAASSRFGKDPYLLRQVGAPPAKPPESVLYRPLRADGQDRFAPGRSDRSQV